MTFLAFLLVGGLLALTRIYLQLVLMLLALPFRHWRGRTYPR